MYGWSLRKDPRIDHTVWTVKHYCRVTSKYRGVRWHYCNSKWEARIFNGARQISLGYFDDEVEAATAYDAQAKKMRGSAAVLNFQSNIRRQDTDKDSSEGLLTHSVQDDAHIHKSETTGAL